MKAPTPPYRRVPCRGLSWRGWGSLWLAEDHLLEATSAVIAERYRRFFFQDVRAFAVQRTNGRWVLGWILGGLGTAMALIAASVYWFGAANDTEDWHLGMYILAGPFGLGALVLLLIFLFNLLRGPRCRCHLLTSTGWKSLSAPTRLGQARLVQEQLVPLIQNVQGSMPAAEAPSA